MRLDHDGKPASNYLGFCALLLAALCAGCGKQEESFAGSPKVQSAMPDEVKTFDTLSAAQTTGISLAGRTNSGFASQILSAVRIGNQPSLDRLVFEFNDAGLPEWEVKYVEQPLLDCGSGEPVLVAGNAWLQIIFRGAQAHTEAGEATSGPRRRVVNQTAVRELVRTCDFEGEVTWVAGLGRANAYTPLVLAEPSRLVIDIAH